MNLTLQNLLLCAALLLGTSAPAATKTERRTKTLAALAAKPPPPQPPPVQPLPTLSAPAVAPRISITERRPGPEDGPPTYAQDEHWLDGSGRTWSMRDQGHGQTVWLFQEPTAPPVDEVGGQRPIAAYGTRRLTAAYAGPAMNVVRNSDAAALDIGFLPTGGMDETLLAAFCAQTECRVAKWYDQSGKGNDATQDSPESRPAIRLSHRVGNAASLIWDFEMTGGAPPRSLTLPDGVSLDSGNMAILWTGRFHNASMISPLIELGTDDNPFGFGFWDTHGDFYIGNAKQIAELPGHATTTPAIGLISVSPDGIVTNYRNHLIELSRLVPGPHRGGFIGRTNAFRQFGMMELGSLILYDRALSTRDRFYGLQAMGETFGIPQQQQDTYVVDGDSISQGIASLYLQSYQRDMERLLPSDMVLYNAAWAGKTLDGKDGLIDRFPTFTAKLYNPVARTNVLSLLAGTNDLQNGQSGQQVFDLIRRYVAAAHKTGFKVVVCTIMPRRSFLPGMEAERVRANALIAAGWQDFADGFVDLAADPVLGGPEALKNPNVYISDGIHLTDYGYQTLASDMAQVVNRLIR
jgi:lysophospholipase L1-like esterase